MTIQFPDYFHGAAKADMVVDGPTFRAMRVAADDYLPATGEPRACLDTQGGHKYRVLRQGDIIFVQLEEDLESCGVRYPALDSTANYAIRARDGRILRRLLAGEFAGVESRDGGRPLVPEETPSLLDGGSVTEWGLTESPPDASINPPAATQPESSPPPSSAALDAGTPVPAAREISAAPEALDGGSVLPEEAPPVELRGSLLKAVAVASTDLTARYRKQTGAVNATAREHQRCLSRIENYDVAIREEADRYFIDLRLTAGRCVQPDLKADRVTYTVSKRDFRMLGRSQGH